MKENLFSTPLWSEHQFINRQELDPLKKKIIDLNNMSKKDTARTVANGWRIDNPHRLSEFKSLASNLVRHCKIILEEEIKHPVRSLTFTSWLNIINNHGYNKPHHHGTSLMSGVFYIIVPDGSGIISFKDPRPGAFFNNNPNISPLGCNLRHTDIKPAEGLLLIFPGYLEHLVVPSTMQEENAIRASLAFNINVDE